MAAFSSIVIGGLAVVNAGMQVAGGVQARKQAKEAAKQARREAAAAIELKKEQIEVSIGEQESAFASSGVDITGEESEIAVLNQTRLQGLREIETIRRQGVQAANNINAQGRAALTGSVVSAVSTVASSAASIYGGAASSATTNANNFQAGSSYLGAGGLE